MNLVHDWKESIGQLSGCVARLMDGKKAGKNGQKCFGELKTLAHSARMAAVFPIRLVPTLSLPVENGLIYLSALFLRTHNLTPNCHGQFHL